MRDGSKYMRHKLFRHNVIVTHYKPDILHEKPDGFFLFYLQNTNMYMISYN